jgi:hypothetical protein
MTNRVQRKARMLRANSASTQLREGLFRFEAAKATTKAVDTAQHPPRRVAHTRAPRDAEGGLERGCGTFQLVVRRTAEKKTAFSPEIAPMYADVRHKDA